MDLSVSPRLQRQALTLTHALLSHEERTTNPTRLYQIIGRSFARWRRRSTLVLIDKATRYEPLHAHSIDELRTAIRTANSLRIRLHLAIPDFNTRAIESYRLLLALGCMNQEIQRQENALRRSADRVEVPFTSRDQGDYIVRYRRSRRGTHRQSGHL